MVALQNHDMSPKMFFHAALGMHPLGVSCIMQIKKSQYLAEVSVRKVLS